MRNMEEHFFGVKASNSNMSGSSNDRAIFNAIRVAQESLAQDVAGKIAALLQQELRNGKKMTTSKERQ